MVTVWQHGFWGGAGGCVSLLTSVTALMVSPWISCSFSFSLTEDPEMGWEKFSIPLSRAAVSCWEGCVLSCGGED